MGKEMRVENNLRNFWVFIFLAFGLSFIFWIPAALMQREFTYPPVLILFFLGGFGPSIAGIILTHREQNSAGRAEFWRRVFDFKRISLPWYLVIFLLFPFVFGIGVLGDFLTGGPVPQPEVLPQIFAQPLLLIPIILLGLLLGPISEELGWRGYALDKLQFQWSPLSASLFLAIFWWAWHLPLFFVHGTTQALMGIGSLKFWFYMISIFPLSVLMTWVYNHNARSILAAILLHFTYNFTASMFHPLSTNAELYKTILLFLGVGIIVAMTGIRNPGFNESR
jgi:uncharacterized protein